MVADFFILIGSLVILAASIGMMRMPDFFTRLHPASVKESLGIPLIIIGLCLQYGFDMLSLKAILIWLFMLITAPTACHAIAKSALLAKEKEKHDI